MLEDRYDAGQWRCTFLIYNLCPTYVVDTCCKCLDIYLPNPKVFFTLKIECRNCNKQTSFLAQAL